MMMNQFGIYLQCTPSLVVTSIIENWSLMKKDLHPAQSTLEARTHVEDKKIE